MAEIKKIFFWLNPREARKFFVRFKENAKLGRFSRRLVKNIMIKLKFFLIIIFLAFSHASFSMKATAKGNITACLFCRNHKRKCDRIFEKDKCSNCQFHREECVRLPPKKRGRKKRTKPEEPSNRHIESPKEKFTGEKKSSRQKTITADCFNVSKNMDEERRNTEEPKNISQDFCDHDSYCEEEINRAMAFNNSTYFSLLESQAPENENSETYSFFRMWAWHSIFDEPLDVCDFPHLTEVLDGFLKK